MVLQAFVWIVCQVQFALFTTKAWFDGAPDAKVFAGALRALVTVGISRAKNAKGAKVG